MDTTVYNDTFYTDDIFERKPSSTPSNESDLSNFNIHEYPKRGCGSFRVTSNKFNIK